MMRGAFEYAGYRLVQHPGCYRAEAIGEEDDLLILEAQSIDALIVAIDAIEAIDPEDDETVPMWFAPWMRGVVTGPVRLSTREHGPIEHLQIQVDRLRSSA